MHPRTLLAAVALLGSTSIAHADPTTDAIPTNIRLTRVQREVEALKSRAVIAKMQADHLKEELLGGGTGASATIVHDNEMGGTFRLTDLTYAIDGSIVYHRATDDLWKARTLEIFAAPIAPGGHTLSVVATYHGHGYGVFKYLDKYVFRVRSSQDFTAVEGKATRVEVHAAEQGDTARLEDRPIIRFAVTAADTAAAQ